MGCCSIRKFICVVTAKAIESNRGRVVQLMVGSAAKWSGLQAISTISHLGMHDRLHGGTFSHCSSTLHFLDQAWFISFGAELRSVKFREKCMQCLLY